MTDDERFGQKFLWIRPRGGGVNLSCGMAGETDLTAEEVREVIVRLREAIGDPDPQDEIERLRSEWRKADGGWLACGGRVRRLQERLRAAPMPERESIYKGEEYQERYADWWHACASEDALRRDT